MRRLAPLSLAGCIGGLALFAAPTTAGASPKTIVISLDGATPRIVEQYLGDGSLPANQGFGLLKSKGIAALRNTTVTPSLTAPGHIAIATGSTAAKNDVVANTFALLSSPFGSTVSGFAGPIGGYDLGPPAAESSLLTATPLWQPIRAAGKTVLAATRAGADGANILLPGTSTTLQLLSVPAPSTVQGTPIPLAAAPVPTIPGALSALFAVALGASGFWLVRRRRTLAAS